MNTTSERVFLFYFLCRKRKEECIASVHFVHKNIHNFRFRRKSKKKTFERFFFLFFCFSLVDFIVVVVVVVWLSSVSFFTKSHQTHYHKQSRQAFSANRLRSLLTEQELTHIHNCTTTTTTSELS